MATSTLHNPPDSLPDLADDEDLQTGPPELPKEQRILLALHFYHKVVSTPQAEPICQIARRFRISRSTLQDRIKGAKSKKEYDEERQLLSPAEEASIVRWII